MLHCFLSVLRSIALLHLFCVLVLLNCIIIALVMLYCTYIVRWRGLLCTFYILRLASVSFIVSFILVHLSRFGHWRCDFYFNDTWKRTEIRGSKHVVINKFRKYCLTLKTSNTKLWLNQPALRLEIQTFQPDGSFHSQNFQIHERKQKWCSRIIWSIKENQNDAAGFSDP